MKAVIIFSITLAGCASFRPFASSRCSPQAPAIAQAPTPELIDGLAGRFRLTQVLTSFKSKTDVVDSPVVLELRKPDSSEHAVATKRSIGHPPRVDLRLLGTLQWNGTQPAEWDAGTLYLGCRDCMDGSPDHLRITAVAPTGFWGTWVDYQTGIVRVTDEHGKLLPNPAGYFCAERI